LIQLQSGHIPINSYLRRIGKRDNDHCNNCKKKDGREIPETVNHFILDCPAYRHERDSMMHKLGRSNTYKVSMLFSKEKNIHKLLNYLDATKRFRKEYRQLAVQQED
jgi:hypothetical protein